MKQNYECFLVVYQDRDGNWFPWSVHTTYMLAADSRAKLKRDIPDWLVFIQ